MASRTVYRGHLIVPSNYQGFAVFRDDKLIGDLFASEDAAMKWIDDRKRDERLRDG